jgi:hypothetical protein
MIVQKYFHPATMNCASKLLAKKHRYNPIASALFICMKIGVAMKMMFDDTKLNQAW